MNSFRTALHSSLLRKAALGIYAGLFLVFGLYPEIISPILRPRPGLLFIDFHIYLRALNDALSGVSPYAVRAIEAIFWYPPPSLLIFDLFHFLQPFYVQIAAFTLLSIALMILMIRGIARQYGHSFKQTWYWYALGLLFAPFLESLRVGQITMIALFGLFVLFYWEERSPVLSGLGLGIAILTKMSPVLFFGYLLVNKRFKIMGVALAFIVLMTGLSILRYGFTPLLDYPNAFLGLFGRIPLDVNSQSLAAKLSLQNLHRIEAGLPSLPPFFQTTLETLALFFTNHAQLLQRLLLLYTLLLIGLSGVFTFLGKQSREPLFMITLLGMMLSPNVVWYHHYIFILLPLLMWIARSGPDRRVVFWVLAGLLIIEIDRRLLTYGLLAQLFGQASLLVIFISQAKTFWSARRARQVGSLTLADA